MKRKVVYIACSLLLLTSCASRYGNSVKGGDLTVYFEEQKDEKFAITIAEYLRDNNLLTGKKQDIQLIRVDGRPHLRLISNGFEGQLSFEELKLMLALQDSIRQHVQLSDLEIVISNSKFEEITNINE